MENSPRICCAAKAVMMLAVCLILVVGLAAQETGMGGRVMAERTDPATGARWVLVRDATNAAGPGRWMLAASGRQMGAGSRVDRSGSTQTPVIHAGDRIVLEEQTAVLEARFEATALTGAEIKKPLRARLTTSGRVLSARAIAPGLAEIEEETR